MNYLARNNRKAKRKKRLSIVCGVALVVSALSMGRGLALLPIEEELLPIPGDPLPLPIPTPVPDPTEILFPPEEPSPTPTPTSTATPAPAPAPADSPPPTTGSGGGSEAIPGQPIGVTPPKIAPPPVVLPGSVPALNVAPPTSPDGVGAGLDEFGFAARATWGGRNDPGGYLRAPGGRSTFRILEIMRSIGALPYTVARILAPFPVAGEANYSDDWGQPRGSEPYLRSHEGTDIFADQGTSVIASSAGTVELTTGGISGYAVKLVASDRTYYFYAHLQSFAPRLVDGMTVSPGQVLGFVGTSGNAAGTPPHLHFEIHPGGGPAVPPVPYLDRWLAEALSASEALAESPVRQLGQWLGAVSQKGAKAVARLPLVLGEFKPVSGTAAALGWAPLFLLAFLWWLRRRSSLIARPAASGADRFLEFP